LAGEIPSSETADQRAQKIKGLLSVGATYVIDLTEEGECNFKGQPLVDYHSELQECAAEEGADIKIKRLPITDLSIPTEKEMRNILDTIHSILDSGGCVYFHCWGGVGRTGTVLGCFLLERKMANETNVFEIINYLKRTTPIQGRVSPETPEQMEFVLNWAR